MRASRGNRLPTEKISNILKLDRLKRLIAERCVTRRGNFFKIV